MLTETFSEVLLQRDCYDTIHKTSNEGNFKQSIVTTKMKYSIKTITLPECPLSLS